MNSPAQPGTRSAGRRRTGGSRRPGPRRSRSRSRTRPAPRARRARSGRRARPRARPASFAAAASSGAGSRQPKKFGCWKITAAASSAAAASCVRIGRPAVVRHLDHLEPEPRRVGLHDLAHLRIQRLGEDDLRAARGVLGDVAGVGGDGRAVVAGGVRDVHPGQLADRGLVLEDRLQDALAHLGLVRRVGRQELAALRAPRRRPPARSGRRCPRRGTRARAPCATFRAASSSRCATSSCSDSARLEVELAVEAHARRDVPEELVDRVDADRREHRRRGRRRSARGSGQLLKCSARTCV